MSPERRSDRRRPDIYFASGVRTFVEGRCNRDVGAGLSKTMRQKLFATRPGQGIVVELGRS
jgi:hypothetical protein